MSAASDAGNNFARLGSTRCSVMLPPPKGFLFFLRPARIEIDASLIACHLVNCENAAPRVLASPASPYGIAHVVTRGVAFNVSSRLGLYHRRWLLHRVGLLQGGFVGHVFF